MLRFRRFLCFIAGVIHLEIVVAALLVYFRQDAIVVRCVIYKRSCYISKLLSADATNLAILVASVANIILPVVDRSL